MVLFLSGTRVLTNSLAKFFSFLLPRVGGGAGASVPLENCSMSLDTLRSGYWEGRGVQKIRHTKMDKDWFSSNPQMMLIKSVEVEMHSEVSAFLGSSSGPIFRIKLLYRSKNWNSSIGLKGKSMRSVGYKTSIPTVKESQAPLWLNSWWMSSLRTRYASMIKNMALCFPDLCKEENKLGVGLKEKLRFPSRKQSFEG